MHVKLNKSDFFGNVEMKKFRELFAQLTPTYLSLSHTCFLHYVGTHFIHANIFTPCLFQVRDSCYGGDSVAAHIGERSLKWSKC